MLNLYHSAHIKLPDSEKGTDYVGAYNEQVKDRRSS
jgi:hypothetical protein